MKIINQSNNTSLASDALIADKPLARVIGLLNKRRLLPGEGLVIRPCNSVHTFFMRFPIDIAFVDKQNKVVKIIHSLPPFRISAVYFSSFLVVELPAGILAKTNTRAGDTLVFI